MKTTSGQVLALAMLKAFEQPTSAVQLIGWANWLCSLPVKELEVMHLIVASARSSEDVRSRIGLLGYIVDFDPRYHAKRREMDTRQLSPLGVYTINPLA